MKRKTGMAAVLSEVKNDKITQKQGKVKTFDGEPAVVRVSQGCTLNMGNYQSLRLGVDLSLPCNPKDVEKAFKTAATFVEKHLASLVKANQKTEEEVGQVEDFNL